MSAPPRVLYTAGSSDDAARLGGLFTRAGWTSIPARSPVELAELLARGPASLVVLSEAPEREPAIDVCRRIRLEPAWNHIPVLVRLRAPSPAGMAACLDGGADACLPASADDEILHLRLRALLRQTTEPSELPPWTDGRRLRILAIDDDAIYLDLLCAALELDTHEVLTALDGETGVRLARLGPCDCAIIDRRLPGLDGLEVCRQIAAMRHDTNWFPIVVLTAIDDPADRQVAFELGIDEFILKSDGMTLIRARIAAVIRRRALLTARRSIVRALAEREAAAAEARSEANLARHQAAMVEQLAAVNRELIAARDAAIKAARSRSEFLANMSHELRTPLHAIIGTVSLVADALVASGRGPDLEILSASAAHLLAVINSILDFSKLDAGSTALELGEVEVGACLDEALLMIAPAANAKRLEIVTEIGEEVPERLLGDRVRLRQVLVNLVANAVKFTARGEVRVSLRARPRGDALVNLEVAVADTGPGIPKAVQERLFLPFVQADESTARVYGGTGLGLAISRKLVELMGGTLAVESAPGSGATFSFAIPVAPIAAAATTAAAREPLPDLAARSIVVAHHNARARASYATILGELGARVDVIASLAELKRHLEGATPSLLVLDAWLADDGAEPPLAAARRLCPALPLLLLSGDPLPASPGVHVVQKPVRRERLPALVQRSLATPLATSPPELRPRLDADFAAAHPLRILAVEDNAFNLRVLRGYLSRLGYSATYTSGGAEGIAAALGAPYDLVLLDLQMPEIDGLEVSRRIRERLPRGALWICAMTASTSDAERQRCIDAGMDDFISKPVPVEVLREALTRAWQARRAAEPPTPAERSEPDSAPRRRIARATAAGVLRLDADLGGLVDALERARGGSEVEALLERARSLAHAICGLAGSVGFAAEGESIAAVEREIERVLASAPPPPTPALSELAAIARAAREAVRARPKAAPS